MIITEIKNKKNGTEYEIYIDDSQKLILDISLVMKYGIKKELVIDEEFLNILNAEANYKSAYEYSIRLLTLKDRVSSEIVNKLIQRNYSQETIDMVLAKLIDLGYIDDEKYIENWLKLKSKAPGMSKRTLYYKLLRKGVDRNILENKFKELDIDEFDTAFLAAGKKVKSIKGDRNNVRNKLYMYLKRKGYNDETCYNVIRKVLKDSTW